MCPVRFGRTALVALLEIWSLSMQRSRIADANAVPHTEANALSDARAYRANSRAAICDLRGSVRN
jgi:hypothetical protein